MPPTKPSAPVSSPFALKVGQVCNVVVNGQLMPACELLDMDDKVLTFRSSLQISPQCEVVLIPWTAVERIGLVGVR